MSLSDRINDVLNPNENYHVKNTLSSYANYEIMKVNICRTPVEKVLLEALTFLNSKFKQFTKSYTYDKIFHLYAIFECKNPENGEIVYIRTEKNPRVVFQTSSDLDLKTKDHYDLDLWKLSKNNPITVEDLILETKKLMGSKFDQYNPVDNNCQSYILSLIEAFFRCIKINYVPDAIKRYIYLNVSKALNKNSFAGILATKITDLGRFFNKLIGKGMKSSIKYALSDDDIKKFFKNKIKIIKYSDLDGMNIKDLLEPYKRCIILLELEDINLGHWCILKFNDKTKSITFFDSYGYFPENELKYSSDKMKRINKPTKLIKILYNQPYQVEYNNHRLQQGESNTCGKYCCVFGKMNMTVDEFNKMIRTQSEKENLTNDQVICKIFDEMN